MSPLVYYTIRTGSCREEGGDSLPETLESLGRMLPTTSVTEVSPAAGPRADTTPTVPDPAPTVTTG